MFRSREHQGFGDGTMPSDATFMGDASACRSPLQGLQPLCLRYGYRVRRDLIGLESARSVGDEHPKCGVLDRINKNLWAGLFVWAAGVFNDLEVRGCRTGI